MPTSAAFHDVLFPVHISLGATSAHERKTEIVSLVSGKEERNTRWADARRYFDAGQGVRTLDDLHHIITFFEERRGPLYAFRWRDRLDWKSCEPSKEVSAENQSIGVGDGEETTFALTKQYGSEFAPYKRIILKPHADSIRVAVDGVEVTDFAVSEDGEVVFTTPPQSDAIITAGFTFDVPVRFDTERLEFNLSAFDAGEIPSIPLVEVRL